MEPSHHSTFSSDITCAITCSILALPMASAALSRRVERVVGYPPLSEASADQRREFHDARDIPPARGRRFR